MKITRNFSFTIISFILLLATNCVAQVDGVVFRDFNVDGVFSSGNSEIGIANVEVNAYDDTGTLVDQDFTFEFNCTAAGVPDASCTGPGLPQLGFYSVTVPAGTPHRIEFVLPADGSLDFLTAGFGGSSSVIFASSGETRDVSFQSSSQYCQDDPDIFGACFPLGPNAGNTTEVLISLPYGATGDDPSLQTYLTLAETAGYEVGSIWGLAYNPINGKVYTAAALKRFSEVGEDGLGAIHEIDPNGTLPNASLFASLSAGSVTHNFVGDFAVDREIDAYGKIGKVGLGDIDISDDGTHLYVMNLNNNGSLHIFNIDTQTEVAQYAVTDPGCSDPTDVRPWATKYHDGELYIGVLCSEEAAGGSDANLSAHVMQLTPGAGGGDFTTILTVPLNYQRETSHSTCLGRTPPLDFRGWYRWDSVPANFPVNNTCIGDERLTAPSPIFGDIEFDIDGSIIMSFIDRFSMQTGADTLAPDPVFDADPEGPLWYTFGAGDILRACSTGPGYILEGNPGCEQEKEAVGDLEYYWGEHHDWGGGSGPLQHEETALGSLAHLFGSGHVVSPTYDPLDEPTGSNIRFNTFGYRWLDNVTGGMVQSYQLGSGAFSKGVQLGDVEFECKQSPVEIGNRVWKDTDGDGIQDPSESPIPGVSVDLFCDTTGDSTPDTLLATAVTDSDGQYLFSSDPMRSADTTASAIYDLGGFGLDGLPNTADDLAAGLRPSFDANADGDFDDASDFRNVCSVRISGYAAQTALAGCAPSANDVPDSLNTVNPGGDSTNLALLDIRDSDGIISGADLEVVFETGESGGNNHSFDFGFIPVGSIGDYVWMDTNADGVQDTGELPIAGVTVKLTSDGPDGINGTADDISLTDVTDGLGLYLFPNLPYADYLVMIDTATLPAGKIQTFDADGTLDHMSTRTIDAVTPDPRDQDFGYDDAPVGSIGDYVWMDSNSDGVQDVGELPIPGVTVKLTSDGPDGVNGTADDISLTDVTDGGGLYLFPNLPYADYLVMIDTATLPTGKLQTFDADGGLDHMSVRTIDATTPDARDQDFGYVNAPVGSIGDYVWMDSNSDGIQDIGELPLSGVTVKLTSDGPDGLAGTADDISLTDVTDASGLYLFVGLPYGDYLVMIDAATLPVGKSQTFDADGVLDNMSIRTIGAADPDPRDQDFGYVGAPTGSIGDIVWCDDNANGIIDAGEDPIANVLIKLTSAGPDGISGTADDINQTSTTDTAGVYLFSDLPYGDYVVMVDSSTLPADKGPTFDFDGNLDQMSSRTLSAADPDPRDQDFGYGPGAQLGDFVWLDVNRNGIQDPGEVGIGGVGVQLACGGADGVLGTADDYIQVDATDSSGFYLFPNIPPGLCKVTFFPQLGYEFTSTDSGIDDTVDSDVDPATRMSGIYSILPGDSNLTVDAGMYLVGGTSSVLWNGFCDQQNFVSMTNVCSSPVNVALQLFGSSGTLLSSENVLVPAGGQVDYSVNSMPGFSLFDYGVVNLVSSPAGCISGSMGLFTPVLEGQFFAPEFREQSLGGVNNLFSLSDGTQSNACYATFNTFNPSLNLEDSSLATVHWLQLANLEPQMKEDFTINRYDSQGELISTELVSLDPMARKDIAVGHEDDELNRYGIVEVVPSRSGARYEAQLFRYGADQTVLDGERMSSFDLGDSCSLGSDKKQYLSVSRGAGSQNWLELQNIGNTTELVSVNVFSNTGGLVESFSVALQPKASQHMDIVSEFLPGESGLVSIESSGGGRILAKSTAYFYRSDGRIQSAFNSEARGLIEEDGVGSYNTFRNQDNWLRLYNVSSKKVRVRITGFEQSGTTDGQSSEIEIEGQTGVDIHLNGLLSLQPDAVGRVVVDPLSPRSVLAELVRVETDSNVGGLKAVESFAVN